MDNDMSPCTILRTAVWPDDIDALAALATSYETDRIYRVTRRELSFVLEEMPVSPPLRKRYPLDVEQEEERRNWSYAVVAESQESVVGFAAAEYTAWNRRAVLWHLYVAPAVRGQGTGTRLLDAIERCAREVGARCVWVETQNTNFPAVRFYLRSGFQLCGLDESLYDPEHAPGEVALFFCKPLP